MTPNPEAVKPKKQVNFTIYKLLKLNIKNVHEQTKKTVGKTEKKIFVVYHSLSVNISNMFSLRFKI